MFEGMYAENIMMHSETRVSTRTAILLRGVVLKMQAIYRYALRVSSYPTLSLLIQ